MITSVKKKNHTQKQNRLINLSRIQDGNYRQMFVLNRCEKSKMLLRDLQMSYQLRGTVGTELAR